MLRIMHLSWVIVFVLLPFSAQASSTKCAKLRPSRADIKVVFQINKTAYDHTKSIRYISKLARNELAQWQRNFGKSDGMYVGHASGLTKSSVRYEFKAKYTARRTSSFSGVYCPYVSELVLTVRYGSKIYVGSEFENGGCYFMEVLDHEHKHHNANMDVVSNLVETLRKDINQIVHYIEEKNYHSNPKSAMNKLQESMQDMMGFYSKDAYAKMKEINAKIDTPEEYRRVNSVCRKSPSFKLW